MLNKPRRFALLMSVLALLLIYQLPGGAPSLLYAQSAGQEAGHAPRPNPEFCTRCYQQLQKDNRNCESLVGQDWQICREAASTAYRQCSQGC